jgi:hypothetical protein
MLVAPRVPDHSCSQRELRPVQLDGITFSATDLAQFADQPMAPIQLDKWIDLVPPDEVLLGGLPFDLKKHPHANTHVAESILTRLGEDSGYYANLKSSGSSPRIKGVSPDVINAMESNPGSVKPVKLVLSGLLKELRSLRDRDNRTAARGIESVLKLANNIDASPPRGGLAAEEDLHEHRRKLGVLFARDHGQEPLIWLGLLVGTLLSSVGFSDIKRLNPFLSFADLRRVEDMVGGLMLTVNRMGQADRAIALCVDTLSVLDKLEKTKGRLLT